MDGERLFFKNNEQSSVNATIFGHTCDGLDVVARNIVIPDNIEIGDWFIFAGMGAYTYSLISQFNNMNSCSKIMILEDKERYLSTGASSIEDIVFPLTNESIESSPVKKKFIGLFKTCS